MTHDTVARAGGLRLEDIRHGFDGNTVVDGVSLAIGAGELVCLLGPSGCGKTTTLRIAAGLERPREGRVLLDGAVVSGDGVHLPPERRHVGLLFQDFALFPHLSVADNVAFGLGGRGAAAKAKRVDEALAQVGMGEYRDVYPHTLSGGQQQRVALARALAPEPRLMLLDEPFSGLDSRLRDQVRDDTLHVLKNSGVATLMVTHDPEEAMFMADRIALMRDGRIEQLGRPVDLYCAPVSAFVASFFGEVNRLRGVVEAGGVRTPFGALPAAGFPQGAGVEVLIRPEALRLRPSGESAAVTAQVLAARLLGRTSLIHLRLGDGATPPLHLHSRMPGRFLPAEGEIVEVDLDAAQAFVFAADDTK